jgi:hypothetical protein
MAVTLQINNISVRKLLQPEAQRNVQNKPSLSSRASCLAISDNVAETDFYQRLQSIPNTIISLQYNENEFLSFNVSEAQQGHIVWSGLEVIGLKCFIHGMIYTFNREHLNQMSNRERHELCNHLEIDDSQLFLN